ncbi:MAG: hypothetical protein WBL46_07370, partial [Nitrososphaeraceae archaeon]
YGIVFEPMAYPNQTNHMAELTIPNASVKDHQSYLTEIVGANHLVDIKNPYVFKKLPMNSSVQIDQPNGNTP